MDPEPSAIFHDLPSNVLGCFLMGLVAAGSLVGAGTAKVWLRRSKKQGPVVVKFLAEKKEREKSIQRAGR